jgi:hypothetical protein
MNGSSYAKLDIAIGNSLIILPINLIEVKSTTIN